MSLQKQLNPSYNGDGHLRDLFMTALNISPIQITLQDCILITAQHLANRNVNRLSEKPTTAGWAYVSHYQN